MKYRFEQLINRSYEAIKSRSLITSDTLESEFFLKMKEELKEVAEAFSEGEERYIEELTDLATVVIMQIHHLGYNFIDEFEKVVIKNETRDD
jgi:NTP pyrophosphatase (non-canonical NTP hydrolase)